MFSHGRLRLYLLKLLAEGPKHGYELIRLLENRFLGLYAPSAGTIYPRLSRMETEGLVRHTAAGGRKTYEITDAGRAELRQRAGEVAELETEIRHSVADLAGLAADIQSEVSGSVRDLKRELRAAARQFRSAGPRAADSPVREAAADPSARPPAADRPGSARAGGPAASGGAGPAAPGSRAGQGWAGAGRAGRSGAAGELERKVAEFAGEAAALIGERWLTDAQARTAIRILDGALEGLRRLLR
ncbi:PadR family transcriptional regulator [Plantactinospora siamensis]|uniref:PadR family transcriptional regulator n=1 Tax=Plantactinospora siamensis TaxID=555372 RepID=UPI0035E54C18